ncbi:transcriptional regulator, XRE family [Desulfofarcimen acetoxidans DSM 771]|uniref:Transcriptional regulator, XRE family n=1 Tax=Desulfofarcimen acetoxidans (strain ATCC 49208 / DSM 771 / KCTC 5769 / VKM B-1644 / 5575) TaxID=485916 RepID=C8W0I6_DESAS|nr:helix-turn-helix transcriptional regulator [Desulfofarcimen acetoxidans]ACV63241.1 transcriptional regulator, XRE family [Desulfofarcimen acetoxidans DSM 771]
MATFGERLYQLRKSKNLKAEELAEFVGLKRRIIFLYEKNESKPSYDTLILFADFFNVSLDYLVGRSDNPQRILSALSITLDEFFSDDSAPEMLPEVRQIVNKVIKLPHEKIKILNDVLDTWVDSD